ncbi:peptidoglycan-recognition protein LC isoform X8 [Drosophila pseudoobscura]|uniref:Peptidoglycan-recognition protein LC isoform X8 n=1 Tax=Drosophila pseudoobscura pseudoobscura TaxID=46245 RepID=A0A6I8W9Z9_DROPS|nr:peptidoglycan-recognition protein LC isoform X8 [Drosophila pseudoobscura]
MLDSALECCQKCRGVIATIPSRIKCDNGLCSRVLHSQCTGLTKEQLKLLETIPNLSWKCDGCLGSNQNQSSLQLSKWLEQSLRQHEKRLEVLEQRSKLDDPGQQAPMLCPYLPNTISRKAISITVAFVLLTTLLGIILATTTNLFGKTLNKNQDNIGGGLILRFVHRQAWLAQPPQKTLADLMLPVSLVIVLPTNSDNCSTQAQCVLRVRLRQTFDIESLQEDDIAFNFVIGGDGNVYVGRGWNQVGAHMSGYNVRSLSFAYIGSFQNQKPSAKQLSVTHLLLERGVSLGKISPNYRLTGASKLEPSITEYKADQLYQSFSNWTHWS